MGRSQGFNFSSKKNSSPDKLSALSRQGQQPKKLRPCPSHELNAAIIPAPIPSLTLASVGEIVTDTFQKFKIDCMRLTVFATWTRV